MELSPFDTDNPHDKLLRFSFIPKSPFGSFLHWSEKLVKFFLPTYKKKTQSIRPILVIAIDGILLALSPFQHIGAWSGKWWD